MSESTATGRPMKAASPWAFIESHPWLLLLGVLLIDVVAFMKMSVSGMEFAEERFVNGIVITTTYTAYLLWNLRMKEKSDVYFRSSMPIYILSIFIPILAHRLPARDLLDVLRIQLILGLINVVGNLMRTLA